MTTNEVGGGRMSCSRRRRHNLLPILSLLLKSPVTKPLVYHQLDSCCRHRTTIERRRRRTPTGWYLDSQPQSTRHPFIRHTTTHYKGEESCLLMAQNSDSTSSSLEGDNEESGDGNGREKRKPSGESDGGGSKKAGRKSRSKSRKGDFTTVVKGSAAERTSKKSPDDKRQKKRQKKRNHTKRKSSRGKKSNALVTQKGNHIQTSAEDTSLKGFSSSQAKHAPKSASKSPKSTTGDESSLKKRIIQLETIVSSQVTEIQKLQRTVADMNRTVGIFSNVVDVLRDAGLQIDDDSAQIPHEQDAEEDMEERIKAATKDPVHRQSIMDAEIFGIAPTTVTDAADAAGSSILSAILAGKHRMLVDVRDAELTRDPKLFVEFIELAILPVAAGLEGLDGEEYERNRVKIVFPTVKDLMTYRRSMALAAPEVVSLSTLGFDPIDERDNLIVVIAPSPDDAQGVSAFEKLIARTDRYYAGSLYRITQPVVVLNHHMVPIDMKGFGKFTSVYHLRLLSVNYMTGDSNPNYIAREKFGIMSPEGDDDSDPSSEDESVEEDDALEAAMTHAHEIGVHQGVTRAMVIRAYPRPWHVFVDTSPDSDADFEVAATFEAEPTQEDINYAIVECLEGSEREDEIVAAQMQAALDAGQLNRVGDMLGISEDDMRSMTQSGLESSGDSAEGGKDGNSTSLGNSLSEWNGNDWDNLFYDDWFNEDSV